jgi:hypothetical protein
VRGYDIFFSLYVVQKLRKATYFGHVCRRKTLRLNYTHFRDVDEFMKVCSENSGLVKLLSLSVISRTAGLNIQKFYMLLTLRLSVLYGLVPCTALTDGFCIPEVESVYCAVRSEPLSKTDKFSL